MTNEKISGSYLAYLTDTETDSKDTPRVCIDNLSIYWGDLTEQYESIGAKRVTFESDLQAAAQHMPAFLGQQLPSRVAEEGKLPLRVATSTKQYVETTDTLCLLTEMEEGSYIYRVRAVKGNDYSLFSDAKGVTIGKDFYEENGMFFELTSEDLNTVKLAPFNDERTYEGDIVISANHPAVTMQLVRDHIRSAYLLRIETLSNSPGAFTVYAKLRPGTIRHLRHSIFVNNDFMIHFGDEVVDGFARSLDIVTFREMPGNRESYAEELIRKAAVQLPGLPEAIEKYWTSTPKTWERYTGTPGGSAYGIRKNSTADFLAPQTPLPWLFLTGQNLGLHGILGTSVSALNTCNTISLL